MIGVVAGLVLGAAAPGRACDICAVYIATEVAEGRTGPRIGVGEQYSAFRRVQEDGEQIHNGEYVNSSITQLLLAWQFNDRIGAQLSIPFISRTFRRLEGGRLVRGDATGVGDLSLIANVLAWSRVTDASVFRFSLLGGLKLPSGNPDRLAEELAEPADDHDDAPGFAASGLAAIRAGRPRHVVPTHEGGGGSSGGGLPSGVHGHDLALGSGSVDGIVGGNVYWSIGRAFLTAGLQYAVRTEGAFDYRFANDLTWLGGPGYYVLLEHQYTLGLQAVLSGETKGKDSQQGRTLDDTAITALYVGPGVTFTWGTALSLDVAVDLPAIQHTTSVQIVPDYRVRGGLVWRF